MKRATRLTLAMLAIVWGSAHSSLAARTDKESAELSLQQQLRLRLEHPTERLSLTVGAEPLHATRSLPAFYERRLYQPAWLSGSSLSPAAKGLLTAIRDAGSDGLEPAAYHLEALQGLLAQAADRPSATLLADLDLLLTDAFLILGAHMVSGRVDPETFEAEWIAYRREVDLVAVLERALAKAAARDELQGLRPDHRGYDYLRSALTRYRMLTSGGGWQRIATGPTLRPGESDPRVPSIRSRLAVTDAPQMSTDGEDLTYDAELEGLVRRFQARHGLDEDGVIGDKTLAALNVSVDQRALQIELNLERWRWLPQSLGARHVLVNIPNSRMALIEDDRVVLEMRAAVGRRYRSTPVFSDTIRYLVFNPYWDVPHRLAVQDKLPEIQKDPEYLARMGFRVYQGWGSEQVEIDPATVDWSRLSPNRFPYRLRQNPGPLNALGRVKFMFPNKFNVYLHDTPNREVFLKAERDVSSGCIRLEKPLELAERLLGDGSRWNSTTLAETIATGQETVVSLDRPVPVHLLYWTAWADEDGAVHFRRDLYGRDEALAEALRRSLDDAPGRVAG